MNEEQKLQIKMTLICNLKDLAAAKEAFDWVVNTSAAGLIKASSFKVVEK